MSNRISKRRGSVLVLLLLVTALLAVLASVAADVVRAGRGSSRAYADSVRTELAMRSAIEHVVAEARVTLPQFEGSHRIRSSDAEVVLTLHDEIGRIDINCAEPELLAGIFKVAGVSQDAAARYAAHIVEKRGDLEDQPHDGKAAPNAKRPGTPFRHVSELAAGGQIPVAAVQAIQPFVTVTSGQPRINPMLALPPVILAIPGVDKNRLADFLDGRAKKIPYRQLITRLGLVEKYATEANSPVARLDGEVRLRNGTLRRFNAVISVVPGDSKPYRILSWTSDAPR